MNTYTQELANFIFTSKYARFDETKKRRETWDESVDRLLNMHLEKFEWLPKDDLEEITKAFDAVKERKNVPSMRALKDDTPILTKNGWKTVGTVVIGDILYSSTGKETLVEEVYKFSNIDLYELEFSDHSKLIACGEHLWKCSTMDDLKYKKNDRIVNTLFIKNHLKQGKKNNIHIKNPNPIELSEKLLPIDPYIMGHWLGDGYSSGHQYSVSEEDSLFIQQQYEKNGYKCTKSTSSNIWTWSVTNLYNQLKELSVINNKHIPKEYLLSSISQRLALVQGLMDSDGHVTKEGRCLFHNTNERIIEGFCEILSSLGIKFTKKFILTTNLKHKDAWVISFFTTLKVVRLPRKVQNLRKIIKETNRTNYRTILSVNMVEKGDATCFKVNSDDHTFLVGKTQIVTHNCLQFGGKAVLAHNSRLYNCAVRHVDSIRSFSEIFYLLLCGCGVGIGLQDKYLRRLPDLVNAADKTGTVLTYVIEDTIEGWSDSIEALLSCYFRNTAWTGRKIVFDYSKIRKKGAVLKTGGGRAPGYRGLKKAHIKIKYILDFIIEELGQYALDSINAYDILMHLSDAVLSGGIRRSACSVVFLEDDTSMLNAKTYFKVLKKGRFELNEKTHKYEGYVVIDDPSYKGLKIDVEVSNQYGDYDKLINDNEISWIYTYPQRARSNNSVLLLRDKITQDTFTQIFERTRQFGEPGFVFANNEDTLFNPCFEIGFIPIYEGQCGVQYCNLSSINGAKIKTKEDLFIAAKYASIIGTLQATYTDFPYLSKVAKWLTEEEALLGVSITGMMDNPTVILDPDVQKEAARIVLETNEEWAKKLYINPAARATCIKPEGTSSLVLQSASGIHPHHGYKYLRRVQCNKMDSVYIHFKKYNPHMCEESIWSANKTDDVVAFPIEVDSTVIVKQDLTALSHLEIVKSTQENWVKNGKSIHNKKDIDNNVSCTIIVDKNEWEEVIEYLFNNKNYFAAVSFIGKSGDKHYIQAPLENIVTNEDENKWNKIIENFIPVDYSLLKESSDQTDLQGELVCAGPQGCELPISTN